MASTSASAPASARASRPLRILLVNDDGPPSASSPHILTFYRSLVARGHEVSVVLPSHQRSWGAMAFSIKGDIGVWWYYPDKEGGAGKWETERRGDAKEEWVLIDGSPTTCTNVGLFNQSLLQPNASEQKPFDLVLSGPNLGRNTGAAFCLSSGTLGAAMSGALSNVKAIAVSYGHFSVVPKVVQQRIDEHGWEPSTSAKVAPTASTSKEDDEPQPPVPSSSSSSSSSPPGWKHVMSVAPAELVQLAHDLSINLVERLVSEWDASVGVYNINVPLVWTLRDPQIYWTSIWRNSYPQLFKIAAARSEDEKEGASTHVPAEAPAPRTRMVFAPEMSSMMTKPSGDGFEGTDSWAIQNGHVSITRLKPGFIEVSANDNDTQQLQRFRL